MPYSKNTQDVECKHDKIDNFLHEHKNKIKVFLNFIMNTYGFSFNLWQVIYKNCSFLL